MFFGLILCLAVVVSFSFPKNSYAQQCRAFEQIIVKLRQPLYGYPSVWDASYGSKEGKKVEFDSVLYMEGGTALLVGRQFTGKADVDKIAFIELNRRGRPMREQFFDAELNERPVKMLRHKDGFFVLSSFETPGRIEGQAVQHKSTGRVKFSWYDNDLQLLDKKVISSEEYDLTAQAITGTLSGEGFVVVLRAENIMDKNDIHGVVAEYDNHGNEVWKRSYRVGIPNRLSMVKRVDERSYVAVGKIQTKENEYSGWAMKLDKTGAILWQKSYRMGASGDFKDVIVKEPTDSFSQPLFTFSGTVRPTDGKGEAAWVMRTDSLGQQTWQRYFRMDDHNLSADWIVDYGDGRMLLTVNARRETGTDARDHVRMLALSPRGVLLSDESYIEGYRANATDFIIGPRKERIISAYTEIDRNAPERMDPIRVFGINKDQQEEEKKEQEEEKKTEQYLEFSQDFSSIMGDNEKTYKRPKKDVLKNGWVLLAPALDRYIDPCAPKE